MMHIHDFLKVLALATLSWVLPVASVQSRCAGKFMEDRIYLPLFQVDLDREAGRNTFFSLTNASDVPAIARVNLFDRLGHWAGAFHLNLVPGAARAVDLGKILKNGQRLCDDDSIFALDGGTLQHALTRFESDGERRIARGYLVIDSVESCDDISFYDDGYGMVRSSAPMFGDWFLVDPEPGDNADDGTARGGLLPVTLFEGKHQIRMLGRPGFDSTNLTVFFPGETPGSPHLVDVQGWTQTGEPISFDIPVFLVFGTEVINVHRELLPDREFGVLQIDCGESPCWVSSDYSAQNRYSVGLPAVPLSCETKGTMQ